MGTKPRRRDGKRVKVACMLAESDARQLAALADADDCSVATIARKAIIAFLREQETA